MKPIQQEQIHEVLATAKRETTKRNIRDILDCSLSVDDLVAVVAEVSNDSGNQNTRLRAAELGFRLHGLLRNDEAQQIPNVTIIIKGREDSEVNPILVPRI